MEDMDILVRHDIAGREFTIRIAGGQMWLSLWPPTHGDYNPVCLDESELLGLADQLMRAAKVRQFARNLGHGHAVGGPGGTPIDLDSVLEALSETTYKTAAQVAEAMGATDALRTVQDLLIGAWRLGLVICASNPTSRRISADRYRRYSPDEINSAAKGE